MATRPESALRHRLTLLGDYLAHYDTKERIGAWHALSSRSTVYRRLRPFLSVILPPLPMTPSEAASHTALMLDGFYIAYPSIKAHRHLPHAKTDQSILLLAIDALTHQPVHWAMYPRLEDATSWCLFFDELAQLGFAPLYLVHDGHYGIPLAAARCFPEALHQRCLVHMVRNVHKDVGITPKALLARQLQSLIYQLVKVQTHEHRRVWERAWNAYLVAFLRAGQANIPRTKAFLSLHTVLRNAYERHELFTFLDYPSLPNNTNAIESRNRVLREALRRHRGMPLAQRESMISWLLLFKSTDDLAAIRAHYKTYKEKPCRDTLCDA